MELGESVTGIDTRGEYGPLEDSPEWGVDSGPAGFEIEADSASRTIRVRTASSLDVKKNQTYGPCLYLGPAGQRCNRPALEGGFCATHQSKTLAKKVSVPSRVAAAILGILGVLWPYVFDLVKEISRWLHHSR